MSSTEYQVFEAASFIGILTLIGWGIWKIRTPKVKIEPPPVIKEQDKADHWQDGIIGQIQKEWERTEPIEVSPDDQQMVYVQDFLELHSELEKQRTIVASLENDLNSATAWLGAEFHGGGLPVLIKFAPWGRIVLRRDGGRFIAIYGEEKPNN